MYTQLKVLKKLTKFVEAAGSTFVLTVSSDQDRQLLKQLTKKKLPIPAELQLQVTIASFRISRHDPLLTTINLAKITEQDQLLAIFGLSMGLSLLRPEGVVQSCSRGATLAHPQGIDTSSCWVGSASQDPWDQVGYPMPHPTERGGYLVPPQTGQFKLFSSYNPSSGKSGDITQNPLFTHFMKANQGQDQQLDPNLCWSHPKGNAIRAYFQAEKFITKVEQRRETSNDRVELGDIVQITHIYLPADDRVRQYLLVLPQSEPTRAIWEKHPLKENCEVFQLEEHIVRGVRLVEVKLKPVGVIEELWPAHSVPMDQSVELAVAAASHLLKKAQPVLVDIFRNANPPLSMAAPVEAQPAKTPTSLSEMFKPEANLNYGEKLRELFEKKKFVIKMDKVTGHPGSMQSPGTMQQITRIYLPMDSRVAEKTRTLSPMDPARARWVAHPLNADCEVFRIIETYENNNFLREVMLMPVGLLTGKWPSYTVDLSSPVINALHAAARMIEKTDPVLVEILTEINLSAERSAQAEPYRHPHADAIRELLTESRMVLDIEQQSSNYTELSQVTHIYLAPDIRATAKVLSLPDSDPDKARWMAHPGYGKYEIFKLTENYSQRGGLTGMKLEAVYADAPSDCIYIYDGLLSVNDAISLIKQKVEKRMEELDPILEKAEQELCTGRLLEEAKPKLSPRIAELSINVESFVKEINAFHPAYKTKAIAESEKTTTLRKAILTFLVDKGAEVEEGPCEEEGDWKTGGYVRQTQVYEPADAEIARMLELLNPEQPDRAYLEAHPMAVRYELFRIVEKIQNKGEVVKMYFEVSASLSSTPLKFDIPLSADVEKNMLLAEYMLVNQRHLLADRIEQHQKNKPVQDSQS